MGRVIVNGEPFIFGEGEYLLPGLERLGLHVPHLCHDARLDPSGGCRLCLVHVHGEARPVPACATVATEGMSIVTHTPQLEDERKSVLRLMAWSYPPEVLGGGMDTPFHAELRAHGLEAELRGRADAVPVDDAHPYIRVDMSRCISCFRCQRICDEVQGQFTWRIWGRGEKTELRPDSGTTLRESSCVSCGACADSCPSGALADKTVLELGAPTSWTRTTCPYCGVGCELSVGTREDRLVQVRPVLDSPVSKGHLCVKGRYAFRFGEATDRVVSPLIRDRGQWREASWSEAIGHVASRLRELQAASGVDSVGVLGSARATNEDNYLTQKLARVVLGTNNVDCCARVCHAPSAAALNAMLGAGASTNSFDDVERAKALLVFGSNATENHPIVGARIRQAALAGASLIVADPRRTELADIADVHLQLRAGSNIALLNAMARTILDERLEDGAFLADRVDGLDALRQHLEGWTVERAAAECGVEAELIRQAARLYATAKPAMCMHGLGATEHVQGTESVMGLINLALLTGNLGAPGTGVNPLRGQNNVQGSAHMGCEPTHLTGSATLKAGKPLFEKVWGAPIPMSRGLDWMQMVDAAERGTLKALYAIGYDVLLTNPNAARTLAALSRLELVVVQDMFMSETAREVAHVFLPIASSFEKDGTFMNSERRVQRVRRVLPPPPGVLADWQVLCSLAQAMGHRQGFAFESPEQIWDEIRKVWKAGAGITYARLEGGGLQWPCPAEDHPGTALLHANTFAHGERATLRRLGSRASAEQTSDEYPLVLVTGRRLYQFNAGTMTGRTLDVVLMPEDRLDVSPDDARRLHLTEGQRAMVRSRHGAARLRVHVDGRVRSGEVFATFHTKSAFLNRVTGDGRDRYTNTPELKVTAVNVQPAGD